MREIPDTNIVDEKLKYLVDSGVIPPTNAYTYYDKNLGFKVKNVMSQRYWNRFVNLCDLTVVNYILSFPQSGNWNHWLYVACQERKGIYFDAKSPDNT